MRVITFIILGLIIMEFCVFADGQSVLTDQSYGVIKFGSKLTEIEATIKEKPNVETGDPGCDFVIFKRYPGIKFMIENGIVTRADIMDISIMNNLEIMIGTALEEVKKRYPNVIVAPHQYDPTGHYLIFKSEDKKRAIIFEESDGKITEVRAGLEPSVEYIEGCL